MSEFPNWFEVTARENFEKYVPDVPNMRALQIGAFTGDATQWLLDNRDIEQIVDVDTWEGSDESGHDSIDFSEVEKVYDSRFKNHPQVDKNKSTSDDFLYRLIWPNDYDFIYIDGDHTAFQVALDGLQAWPGLKSGGVIAFDDYTWQSGKGEYYDPKPAIEAFYHIVKTQVDVLAENSQVWLRRK